LDDTKAWTDAALAGAIAALGTLARYDGWSLLPVAALCVVVLAGERRWSKALLFSLIAALGPLYWLAHNRVLYSSALEFYNGQWSAHAIYQRALDAGGFRYPGDHDWSKALLYYRTAAALCLGWPLYYLGAAGLVAALCTRARWAALLLSTGAAFYVFSLYSGGTPIFVPVLWPNTYYNTRYGLSAMPAACLGVAALTALTARVGRLAAPHRLWIAPAVLVLLAVSPWLLRPRPGEWVCWRESDVNSRDRRAWTRSAADYLAPRYHAGDGILISFGDLAGIVRTAGAAGIAARGQWSGLARRGHASRHRAARGVGAGLRRRHGLARRVAVAPGHSAIRMCKQYSNPRRARRRDLEKDPQP
jgi:hypothetical protein